MTAFGRRVAKVFLLARVRHDVVHVVAGEVGGPSMGTGTSMSVMQLAGLNATSGSTASVAVKASCHAIVRSRGSRTVLAWAVVASSHAR